MPIDACSENTSHCHLFCSLAYSFRARLAEAADLEGGHSALQQVLQEFDSSCSTSAQRSACEGDSSSGAAEVRQALVQEAVDGRVPVLCLLKDLMESNRNEGL